MNSKQPISADDIVALNEAVKIADDNFAGHYSFYSQENGYRFYFGQWISPSTDAFNAASGEGYTLASAITSARAKQI